MKFFIPTLLILNLIFSGYLFLQLRNIQDIPEDNSGQYIIKQEAVDLADYATRDYVDKLVGEPFSTSTPIPTARASSAPAAVVNTTETSYLPIGGSLTSTNTDWVDVPGSEFWADFNSDFGESAKITWEATLKVEAGSGKVTARLIDVTHGIELLESQISTESGAFTAVGSGRIYPWAGKNLYKAQIKSLTSTEASFGGAKVKVVY